MNRFRRSDFGSIQPKSDLQKNEINGGCSPSFSKNKKSHDKKLFQNRLEEYITEQSFRNNQYIRTRFGFMRLYRNLSDCKL